MGILRHIPNAITCGNLFCGCVGIVGVFHSDLLLASYAIAFAAVLDFFDGATARWLGVSSPIGKELDSLADMVTFGVLPPCIIFSLIQESVPSLDDLWIPYLAFFMAIFSALRLAKFNIDTRQATGFIGLPTPANAILVASLPLILRTHESLRPYIVHTYGLLIFVAVMCFLMVMEVPLFALKFKHLRWKDNEIRWLFLAMVVILFLLLKFLAVPFVILLYVGLSLWQKPSL